MEPRVAAAAATEHAVYSLEWYALRIPYYIWMTLRNDGFR